MLLMVLEPAPLVARRFQPFDTVINQDAQSDQPLPILIFEIAPDALRGILRYASGSLGRGLVLVEAIAYPAVSDRQGFKSLIDQLSMWIKDIWAIATSDTQFTNISVTYRRD